MTGGKRAFGSIVVLASACGAPTTPSPAERPAAAPRSAPESDAPFRRKVVVIKEQGVTGDGAPTAPGAGAVSASPTSAAPPPEEPRSGAPSCVEASAYAQYRSGYDHMVTIHNACTKSADCQVSTDVNPTPIRVTVAAGATETVLTFRGSPASVFKPTVNCR